MLIPHDNTNPQPGGKGHGHSIYLVQVPYCVQDKNMVSSKGGDTVHET